MLHRQVWIILVSFVVGTLLVQRAQSAWRTLELELKSTPDDGQLFYVESKVGQGERQRTFNLLLATSYSTTWLASNELDPIRGYKTISGSRYDSSWPLPATGTGGGSYFYRIHEDSMQLGSVLVQNQEIAVVYPNRSTPAEFKEQFQFDGILGLALNSAPTGVYYYFNRLIATGAYNRTFSLYINGSTTVNDDDDNDDNEAPKGALMFGGVDEKYYTGNFSYAHLYIDDKAPDREALGMEKTLVVRAVHLDWRRVRPETSIPVDNILACMRNDSFYLDLPPARLRLDSTTKLYAGNKKVLDKIHLDFIGARQVGEKGFYVFNDCHLYNKPDLVFTVDELQFTMTSEEYVLRGEIDGSQVCFSAFKPYLSSPRKPWDHPVWVFGTQFLRKYFTVFDYKNNVVGFATPK